MVLGVGQSIALCYYDYALCVVLRELNWTIKHINAMMKLNA